MMGPAPVSIFSSDDGGILIHEGWISKPGLQKFRDQAVEYRPPALKDRHRNVSGPCRPVVLARLAQQQ